jgi:hypothetical protein
MDRLEQHAIFISRDCKVSQVLFHAAALQVGVGQPYFALDLQTAEVW